MTTSFSLLQQCRTISHILQTHTQLITNAALSDQFTASRLLFALSQLPNPPPPTTTKYAQLIFSQIHHPNTFTWNTIIRILAHSNNPCRSIHLFRTMRQYGVSTDTYTYPFLLKACASMPDHNVALPLHGETLKTGLDADVFVTNALIGFYCKRAEMAAARAVFDQCRWRDLVSWNTIIAGYANCGDITYANKLFDEMPCRDVVSWATMISGYGKGGDVSRAKVLFDEMPVRDVVCWNSMINGYVEAGQIGSGRELFEKMTKRSVVSWSIMIAGYVRNGDPKESLSLFWRMLREGVMPDKFTVVGAIAACGQLGALDHGRWVHSYLKKKKKKIMFDVVIKTALIDMYMKCGCLDLARELFECMSERSVVTWNVMIVGLGKSGCGAEAVELFYRMGKEGTAVDDLIFLGVLTACAHAGMATEAMDILDKMIEFGIPPKVEHYGCLVDLLGRVGRLVEARNVIESMPMKPTPNLWGSLLAACKIHRDVQLAELSVNNLMSLGADDCGMYALMSNIYADEGMWEEVWGIRKVMHEKGMKKEIGRSVVEVDGEVHEFANADSSHSLKVEIYATLLSLFNNLASHRFVGH